ncbi:MAG: hypothetical protein CM1200mP22_02030 [Dehalococcoidia bacterium]|nr:MAG: hypothetical protein CM1200mP22_02030 [Dehalococcoidia bacterium]
MIDRDWDYMTHGIYNTRYLYAYTEPEEREFYRDNIETVKKYTGKKLNGMFGPQPFQVPSALQTSWLKLA